MSDLGYIFDVAIPNWNIIVLLCILYVFMFAIMAGSRFLKHSHTYNAYILVSIFGVVGSVIFNVVIPGTLLVSTRAVLAEHPAENATVSALVTLAEEEEKDVEFGPYFRLVGVSICVGFMFLYIFDYIAQVVNKTYIKDEYLNSPLVQEQEEATKEHDLESHDDHDHCHHECIELPEEYSYCTRSFLILFGSYSVFTGFGIGPLLAIGLPTEQVLFIFFSILMFSSMVLYTMGKNTNIAPISDQYKFWVTLLFPMITPISIGFFWGIFLLIPSMPPFVASLGYSFVAGMTLFLLLAFYMPRIHIEDSIILTIAASICMFLAYPFYLLQG